MNINTNSPPIDVQLGGQQGAACPAPEKARAAEAVEKASDVESTLIENLNDTPLFIPVRAGTVTFSPMNIASDNSLSTMKDIKPITIELKEDGHVAIHITSDGKLEVKLLQSTEATKLKLNKGYYQSSDNDITITHLNSDKTKGSKVHLKRMGPLDAAVLKNLWNDALSTPSLRDKAEEERGRVEKIEPKEGKEGIDGRMEIEIGAAQAGKGDDKENKEKEKEEDHAEKLRELKEPTGRHIKEMKDSPKPE